MNVDCKEAAALLRQADRILLLTHKRPDGDTIGSAAALCRILRKSGKQAWLLHNEDLTPRLAFLTDGLEAPADVSPAYVAAVDIADEQLLTPAGGQYAGKINLCVDHHPSNRDYAAYTCLQPKAAATGEIVFQLMEALAVQPDLPVWEGLYIAVATDTGCFRFSNTTPLSHEIAARCIAAGLDFHRHNRTFFEAKSRTRFQIERRLFDSLRFSPDGRTVCAWLERDWLDGIGANDDDLDNLSTLTMALEGVDCGIILTQNKTGGGFKASVRTHKPADASRICQNFGGGGHPRAAGCTMDGPAETAAERLMAAAEGELKQTACETES